MAMRHSAALTTVIRERRHATRYRCGRSPPEHEYMVEIYASRRINHFGQGTSFDGSH
jgi:hypothetical protein